MFAGSCSGSFYALHRSTGKLAWRYDTGVDGAPVQFHGDPLVLGDAVLTGCDGGEPSHTYAFDRLTGKMLWKQSRPALQSDLHRIGSNVVGRTWNGDLAALDLQSGELRWSVRPENYFFEVGADESPAAFGDCVYFGAADGAVYAVDGRSGATLWRQDLQCRLSASPAVDETSVYVGCSSGHLFRLAREDGRVLAEFAAGSRPIGRLAIAASRLVVLLGENTLVAVDADLSRVVWRHERSEWSSFQPLVWGSSVIAGDAVGNVLAFELEDGSEVWSTRVDGMVRGLGAEEGVLYIGTFSGTLFAFTRAP